MSDLVDSLSRGLRGYWCPMLQYGGLVLRDQTRFKNHGTLTNMDAGTDWVGSSIRGRSGRVLDFDGSNDYVNISRKAADFGLLSLSFWFLPRAMSGTQKGVLQWADSLGSGAPFILVTQQDPGTVHRVYVDAGYRVTINTTVNTWNMLTISQEPGFLWRFYLNGVSQGTYQDDATSLYKSVATRIDIGNGFPSYFDGQCAELALWNRALTASEIQQLYRLGPGWYRPAQPRRYGYVAAGGFKAYWARQQSQIIGGGVR